MRGEMTQAAYEAELSLIRSSLAAIGEPHWKEYLAAWPLSQPRL
jgi:hypothetical protein